MSGFQPRYPNGRGSGFKTRIVWVRIPPEAPSLLGRVSVGPGCHTLRMHDLTVRRQARRLLDSGLSVSEVSRQVGASRSVIREWRDQGDQGSLLIRTCPRCAVPPHAPTPTDTYAYLLGLYLGDGCISPVGDPA